jgi:hypothetical protein
MIVRIQYLAALIIGNASRTVKHETDQRLYPLRISPVERSSFDIGQTYSGAQRMKEYVSQ